MLNAITNWLLDHYRVYTDPEWSGFCNITIIVLLTVYNRTVMLIQQYKIFFWRRCPYCVYCVLYIVFCVLCICLCIAVCQFTSLDIQWSYLTSGCITALYNCCPDWLAHHQQQQEEDGRITVTFMLAVIRIRYSDILMIRTWISNWVLQILNSSSLTSQLGLLTSSLLDFRYIKADEEVSSCLILLCSGIQSVFCVMFILDTGSVNHAAVVSIDC